MCVCVLHTSGHRKSDFNDHGQNRNAPLKKGCVTFDGGDTKDMGERQ